MNVSFCQSNAFKITSPELKEKVYLECEMLFGKKLKRDHFPGPQPVAIEKKDIKSLKDGYVVCEKTDGERAILLLINIDNKPMCFIINRNNEFFFIDLSFKKEVFEGTIFDGELIKIKEKNNDTKEKNSKEETWNYLIHDCMCYNGSSFLELSHRLRYAAIIDCIVKRYNHKEKDPFYVKTKLFYKFGNGLEKTWNHIQKTTENVIDGLIFTKIDYPINFGRDYSLFKWKEEHTFDLLVKKSGKKINLYGTRKSEQYLFKTIKETDHVEQIVTFAKDNDLKKGTVIEFKKDFVPYRIRKDKQTPNGEITLNNTFKNIEEAITIKDLVAGIE